MNPTVTHRDHARYSRSELIRKLKSKLKHRCVNAYLFGSYARGEANADSDVDLIVVAASERSFVDRIRDFVDVVDEFAPADIIIFTPQEFSRLRKRPSPLLRRARTEWIELFKVNR
ncbi:MAG: nucleotidyltransferase domain-containing protein [Myxococcaceae bacterium]